MLIQAINELAHGNPSTTTIAFLKSLEGRIEVPAQHKRVLFSMNEYANIYNQQQVGMLAGKVWIYTSVDKGAKQHLQKMQVDQVGLE